MAQKNKQQKFSNNITIENRRARFDYEIVEKFEAGIELTGAEVKSLRTGRASIQEAWASVRASEIYLKNMHINPYELGNADVNPYRERKLLLHKSEINRLIGASAQKGLTLIPLKIYFNERGWAKLQLGLCRGKKTHDKRETIKQRDMDREMRRDFKTR